MLRGHEGGHGRQGVSPEAAVEAWRDVWYSNMCCRGLFLCPTASFSLPAVNNHNENKNQKSFSVDSLVLHVSCDVVPPALPAIGFREHGPCCGVPSIEVQHCGVRERSRRLPGRVCSSSSSRRRDYHHLE